MKTLFSGAAVVTVDEKDTILEQAYVVVEDEKIIYVGEEKPEMTVDTVIDGKNKVLMPGFVDAHTHVPMSLLRGYADNYNLSTWLYEYIFPAEDRMDVRSVRAGVQLSLAEMIANGITCFADMYNFCDVIAQETLAAGLSANLSRGTVCLDREHFSTKTFVPLLEQEELFQAYHNAENGRIRVDSCIHGEYTSFPELWEYQVNWAKEHETGMHIHLCETKDETEGCIGRYGKTPVQILGEYGVFDVPCLAAHSVYLTEEDRTYLRAKGTTAVHNPVSNLKLGSGVADVPALLKAGVNVALGTDGVSSNNNHDMFQEVNMAALINRGTHQDPLIISAAAALRMATANGAKALRRNTGSIEAGKDADLILVDFDRPHLVPVYSVLSNLVFSARGNDVCLTMARGKILYENGEWKTIDVEKAKKEVTEYGVPLVSGQRG